MTFLKWLLISAQVNAFTLFGISIGETPSLLKPMPSATQIDACIQSQCGPASNNISAYTAATNVKPDIEALKKLWAHHLGFDLNEFIKYDTKVKTAYLDRLEKVLNAGTIQEVGPAHILAAAEMIAQKTFTPATNVLLFINKATVTAQLSDSAAQNLINTINDPVTQKAARLLYAKVLRQQLLNTIDQVKPQSDHWSASNRLSLRLSKLYPGMPLVEAQKADAQLVMSRLDAFEKTYGALAAGIYFDNLRFARALFREAASGADLDAVDSEVYFMAAQTVDVNFGYTDPELMAALLAVKIDAAADIQTAKSQGLIGKLRPMVADEAVQKRLKDTGSACALRSALMFGLVPSKEDYARVQSQIQLAKQAAHNVIPRLVPAARAAEIVGYADATEFILPDLLQDNVKRLRRDLIGGQRQAQTMLGQVAAATDAEIFYLAPVFARQEFTTADPVVAECSTLPSGEVGDATLSSQGRIYLSWFSLRFPQYGISILSHEFGHAVSIHLRKVPEFLPTLSCVANRNPFTMTSLTLDGVYTSDPTWNEEDWGDHFSSLIMNELKATEPNMGCALLNEDAQNYIGNTYTPAKGDVHSAGLYRLLTMATDRGLMTPACQPLVAYAAANNRSMDCGH